MSNDTDNTHFTTDVIAESAPQDAPPPPTGGRPGRRSKARQRGSQRPWTPSRTWRKLPKCVEHLGTSATALRKWLERAERDAHGRVHMPGGVIAEKRGRLWFIGFPT